MNYLIVRSLFLVLLLLCVGYEVNAAAVVDEDAAPSVRCLVWNATNQDYGHVGIHTGKYYISLWPAKRAVLGTAEEGVEGKIVYHPFLDRSEENEREPVQYKVSGVCGSRINKVYEDMLRFNGIDPDTVTFAAGKMRKDQYGQAVADGAADPDVHLPVVSLPRSRWSWYGQNVLDDPYSFYRRNQSCVTAVLSLLRAGSAIVHGLVPELLFDSIILHHSTDLRRVLLRGLPYLSAFRHVNNALPPEDRLSKEERESIERTLLRLAMPKAGGLLSIPNFIGILGEWNNRLEHVQVVPPLNVVVNWTYKEPAAYGAATLDFFKKIAGEASIRRIGDVSAELGRGVIIMRLNLSKLGIGDQGCERLREAGLQSLIWLNLYDNGVTDTGVEHLSQIASLTYLDLGWNDVGWDYRAGHRSTAGIEALRRLPNLRELSLYKNYIYPEHAKLMGQMRSLTTLNLRKSDGKYLTDDDVRNLVHPRPDLKGNPVLLDQLENLSLNKAWWRLTDACIDSLLELPKLKTVDVRNTAITVGGRQRLRDRGIEVMSDDTGTKYPYCPEIAGGSMSLNTGNRKHGGHFLFST